MKLEKEIIFFGRKTKVWCDGKCDLAKGINPPREDTAEGGDIWAEDNYKRFPNKWCVRECDRCKMLEFEKSESI